MLVYEYINNGNLEQWLHGDVGSFSPLTWEIRMNIILGTAKGYCLAPTQLWKFSFLHPPDPRVLYFLIINVFNLRT